MPEAVREGDSHSGTCGHGDICCSHGVSGVFVEGSPNVFINGLAAVRVGDALTQSCPHCGSGSASSGSPNVFINGRPAVRVGDGVSYPGGGGTTTSGSHNTFIN